MKKKGDSTLMAAVVASVTNREANENLIWSILQQQHRPPTNVSRNIICILVVVGNNVAALPFF